MRRRVLRGSRRATLTRNAPDRRPLSTRQNPNDMTPSDTTRHDRPDWCDELDCAVTRCDTEGTVLYQNARSIAVNGDVRGRSLLPCHNERSREIIRRLSETGGRNVYTIEKRGVRKLIYQTAWREGGVVRGLVEFSMELPDTMPHYVRG